MIPMSHSKWLFVFIVVSGVLGCTTPNWLKEGEDTTDTESVTDEISDTGVNDVSQYLYDIGDIYTYGMNGHISLGASHTSIGDTVYEYFSATAKFYGVLGVTDPSVYYDVIDEVDGLNDCGLKIFSGLDLTSETIDWWTVRGVTLSSEQDRVVLDENTGRSVSYDADLESYGWKPRYGSRYDIDIIGRDAPTIRLSAVLPEYIELTDVGGIPAPAGPPTEDLTMEWSSSGSGVVRIEYTAARYTQETSGYRVTPPYYEVVCVVRDTGRFSIPAAILSQIPPLLGAELKIWRFNSAYVDVPGDLRFFVVAAVSDSRRIGVE
jgi:hypothetical protein